MKETFDFYDSTAIKSYNLNESIRYQLKALDGLDAFTLKHSENVANVTCRLCEELHLAKPFLVYCTTCAYLHDIGKMFIPPSILQKPSKLTDEELKIMKTHTTIGYKICMNDLKLRPYALGALYHHESLNGTGYPNGVKKEDIPYEAQIIRVADEFDAITAKRQYKGHIGVVDALKIMIENATPAPSKDGVKSKYGKINPKILKALFKVVIDDTEFEIISKEKYISFLKDEIKRIQSAMKYYNKMEKASKEDEKDYYREEIKYYLKAQEEPDKVPEMIEEFKAALVARQENVDRLYDEVKKIKKLRI